MPKKTATWWCDYCKEYIADDEVDTHPHQLFDTQAKVITRWFTFGQTHRHVHAKTVLDKDTVVEITAHTPTDVMKDCFGDQWSMCYNQLPDMSLFPKGLYVFKLGTFHNKG